MKLLFTFLGIFIFAFVIAQKRYDCILFTNKRSDSVKHRFVGRLLNLTDSSITLDLHKKDTTIYWGDISTIKFRKHNDFLRTILPSSILSAGLLTGGILYVFPFINYYISTSTFMIVGTAYFSIVYTIPIGTIYYFISRNEKFRIKSYQNYLMLKLFSEKYKFMVNGHTYSSGKKS